MGFFTVMAGQKKRETADLGTVPEPLRNGTHQEKSGCARKHNECNLNNCICYSFQLLSRTLPCIESLMMHPGPIKIRGYLYKFISDSRKKYRRGFKFKFSALHHKTNFTDFLLWNYFGYNCHFWSLGSQRETLATLTKCIINIRCRTGPYWDKISLHV